MPESPDALIITAAGINCDLELARAFTLAGAKPSFHHLSELCAKPALLDRFDLIGLPGGFSYGDAIAAGRIMAQIMRQHLYSALISAIDRGAPIIAPCNGFQIAVQMGLLPGPLDGEPWPDEPPAPLIALTRNTSGRFVDRWCRIDIPLETRCVWTQGIGLAPRTAVLPIAHGEGRFFVGSDDLLDQLRRNGQIAVRYAADDNPNGSTGDVAGICDASGLVLGLMPHPERYTDWMQHPSWSRLRTDEMETEPIGLQMFRNAVAHVQHATV